jgi:hypothetical protein
VSPGKIIWYERTKDIKTKLRQTKERRVKDRKRDGQMADMAEQEIERLFAEVERGVDAGKRELNGRRQTGATQTPALMAAYFELRGRVTSMRDQSGVEKWRQRFEALTERGRHIGLW